MSATADDSGGAEDAARLGFQHGQLIQELGYDDDVDHDVRDSLESLTGEELLDEQSHEVVDGVILWWRDDDGDLVDAMVDCLASLNEGGPIWLLTPRSGRDGHVPASDIEEAAPTAGLHVTRTMPIGTDWSATQLMVPRSGRRG